VRILVIAESSDRAAVVQHGLQLGGYESAQVTTLDEALPSAIERTRPDAIVLQASSPGLDLLDRIVDAMRSTPLPLVIFAADASQRAIEHAVRAGAASYIVDGLQAERIPAILRVAVTRFEWQGSLRSELDSVRQKLAERKVVERAKGLLMKSRGLSEDQAYHALRRMAMDRNRRMGEVARSVIEMAELLN
jgi:response regulator NasT